MTDERRLTGGIPALGALDGLAPAGKQGLVGAGGIGMALDTAMNLFQWNRVAMVLLAIFVVVIIAEISVTYIRKKKSSETGPLDPRHQSPKVMRASSSLRRLRS